MKKRILLLLILILLPIKAKADSIYNITMDINLLHDGSAQITEIWNVKADSGSEWYKQIYGLDNQEITNFKVSMENKRIRKMVYK